MPNWIDEQNARQHFEDLARAEAHHHMVKQALAAQAPARRFYGPLLARFGRRMVIWGIQLEDRYSPPPPIAIGGETASGC
jgi:hypothetical protein